MPLRPPADFQGIFRTDDDARAVYSEAAGIARAIPRAVAAPADRDDVQRLVRWAADTRTPIIPRGSGSSMAGGAIGDGVIVDLSRLRAIGDVDRESRSIRVGPGAICGDVDRAVRASGLRFPVDPSSARFCTIGGMCATNAAGPHSMAFGAMRRWVRALTCVFSDGSIAEVRRGVPPPPVPVIDRLWRDVPLSTPVSDDVLRHAGVRKDSSGYGLADYLASGELVDLLVGSEGTLALFVEIELALTPAAAATSSVLGAFATLESAVAAAIRARDAGAVACELLDRTFLDVASSGGHDVGLPGDTQSALLAEVEGDDAPAAGALALRVQAAFREAGATMERVALDPPTEVELWELRHAASPILARLDPSLKSMQFVEDGAVPPQRLADYVRGVRAALERAQVRGVIFGHAGDAHVHVNPLIDVSQPGWRGRVEQILDDVARLTASLGGTLAGEHGDGRLRAPLLDRVWSEGALDLFERVKRAFDPAGVLNPGAKVPLAGQRALDEIKYDPSLPPLPERARRALERVAGDRMYASFRLELLDASDATG